MQFHNIWTEGIFDFDDIIDKGFSGFTFSLKRPQSEDAKSENALSVEKRDIVDWLSMKGSASIMNNLTDSEIADAVLNRIANNARSSSENEVE